MKSALKQQFTQLQNNVFSEIQKAVDLYGDREINGKSAVRIRNSNFSIDRFSIKYLTKTVLISDDGYEFNFSSMPIDELINLLESI